MPKVTRDSLILGMTTADWVRFWRKVDKTSTCWHYIGLRNAAGYGLFSIGGITVRANRVLAVHALGSVSQLFACHACNVRDCIRLEKEHVYMGTQKQNVADSIRAATHNGSKVFGSSMKSAVLNEASAAAIYVGYWRDKRSCIELAEQFHVSSGVVRPVVRGKTWRHATGATHVMDLEKRPRRKSTNKLNHNAKLTADGVQQIRAARSRGEIFSKIAKAHGVSIHTVYQIITGATWKHLN